MRYHWTYSRQAKECGKNYSEHFTHFTSFSPHKHFIYMTILTLILQMRKVRHREVR